MKHLIVVVPGIEGGFAGWDPLIERLKNESALAGGHWLLWDHEKRWYSLARADKLAIDLRARIDQEWTARGPFSDVILVGHSLGGLLVRKAFILASTGDNSTKKRSEWAECVSRLILFAAINRGVDPGRMVRLRFSTWLARAFPALQRLLSWDVLRGSSFITDLRIQWIRFFDEIEANAPTVVQLLGTKDELVFREDSIDLEQFPTAYHIDVPEATHGDLHRLDKASDPEGRYALLRDGFVHHSPTRGENRSAIAGPEQVVFVLHGIRANNRTWVSETIEKIRQTWPDIMVIGDRYKYVSALRFAIPMTRRRNLLWFQDAYSEALALNPRAVFSFIGHSNGTYLFGESLRSIAGMRFERAVLVGSVLPSEYDWDERFARNQIRELRIDGSSHDWAVGWLCSALNGILMRDVGTGGFEGFLKASRLTKKEYFWYNGGHSEPLRSDNLSALASFAITGALVPPVGLRGEVKWFSFVSRALRLLTPMLAVVFTVSYAWLVLRNPLAALAVLACLILVIFIADIL